MPDTSKLEKLNRELEKSEKKLRKAINDEKAWPFLFKKIHFQPFPYKRSDLTTNGLIVIRFRTNQRTV